MMTNDSIERICQRAKAASQACKAYTSEQKDQAILAIVEILSQQKERILSANAQDLAKADAENMPPAMLERLKLDQARIAAIAVGLCQVADLPDPVGEVFDAQRLPNGLQVHKQRIPLGVLAVVYESRPNVTMEISSLCLKSANAVILRGGSESLETNKALLDCIRSGLQRSRLVTDAVQLVSDPAREKVLELLQMHQYIDMLIPRGGAALHNFCRENARIPVITGGIGICHLFVDASADLEKSLAVVRNAKVQRPTVCNALDTLLVHADVVGRFVPQVIDALARDGVVFHVDGQTMRQLGLKETEWLKPAQAGDFEREWLSLDLGIRQVQDLDQAISFISKHGTGHSDGILTDDRSHAEEFLARVDSAAVYANASTRFTDGGQLGLGAEVAISTQPLHARGPMGLRELTTYKWVIRGEYAIRD